MTQEYTLFKLAEETRLNTENVVNRLHRHCKIGRVTKKVMIHGGKMVVPTRWKPDPIKLPPAPSFGGYVPVTSTGDAPRVPAHGVMM